MRFVLLATLLVLAGVVASPLAQAHCFNEFICQPGDTVGCALASVLNTAAETADRVVCHTP